MARGIRPSVRGASTGHVGCEIRPSFKGGGKDARLEGGNKIGRDKHLHPANRGEKLFLNVGRGRRNAAERSVRISLDKERYGFRFKRGRLPLERERKGEYLLPRCRVALLGRGCFSTPENQEKQSTYFLRRGDVSKSAVTKLFRRQTADTRPRSGGKTTGTIDRRFF